MGVLERVPRESTYQARSWWRVERHATAKIFTASLPRSGASVAAAIRGSLRAFVGRRLAIAEDLTVLLRREKKRW
jgi:hypothetical protein